MKMRFLSFAIIVAVLPLVAHAADIHSDLLAYLDFEDTSSASVVKDVSGSADWTVSGTIVRASSGTTLPCLGKAGRMTGGAFLTRSSNAGFVFSNGFSFSGWVRWDVGAFSQSYTRVFDFGPTYALSNPVGVGSPIFFGHTGTSNTYDLESITRQRRGDINLNDAGVWPVNTWTHVAITSQNGPTANISFYVNGALAHFEAWGTNTANVAFDLSGGDINNLIGKSNFGVYGDGNFSGYMDDLRFYNRVLTAEDIAALYTTCNFQYSTSSSGSPFAVTAVRNNPALNFDNHSPAQTGFFAGSASIVDQYTETFTAYVDTITTTVGQSDTSQSNQLTLSNVAEYLLCNMRFYCTGVSTGAFTPVSTGDANGFGRNRAGVFSTSNPVNGQEIVLEAFASNSVGSGSEASDTLVSFLSGNFIYLSVTANLTNNACSFLVGASPSDPLYTIGEPGVLYAESLNPSLTTGNCRLIEKLSRSGTTS